ncbi:hypothetical protein AURDEDRAFT_160112 [Auricularia subglabra TFB-10046 SS5]|nr:hypothetical protein AURDEDRAFT_160112 [Auricularia subglabra TFB-10046 SS5]
MHTTSVLAVAVALLPAALSAPTAGCTALKFSSGVYGPNDHVVVGASIPAVAGQTVTGTVVNLSTCQAYTAAEPPVVRMEGQVVDADTDWSNPEAAMSGKTVEDTNELSFVAEVPNGSEHLNTGISVVFSGGTLENFNHVLENVGILYTLD